MNREYRPHFCKIYSLPIKIFDSPYFEKRLKLMNDLYSTEELQAVFEKEIALFPRFELYLKEYEATKERVIQHIQNKPSFQIFINEDFSKYKTPNIQVKKQNLYQPDNNNKYFLGFDLKEANFNSLKYFNNDIVDGYDNWESFFSQFTNQEHLLKSKYIRQVILGACNPSRQVTMEKFLMFFVYEEIKKFFTDDNIIHFSEDEIILDVKEHAELEKKVQDISSNLGIGIRIEKYKLVKVSGADVYFKVFQDGTTKLKCGNPLIVPFVIRGITDSKIEDHDLYFMHDGMLSKLIDTPQIFVPLLKY